MTVSPTTTATRSTTPAAAAKIKDGIIRIVRISKRLPDGKEKLKVISLLDGWRGAAKQKLLISALQTVVRRRVNAVRQIDANRSYGRAVADAETGGVHHIIEIRDVFLVDTERELAQIRVDVSHIMKEHALDVVSDQRKAQFGGMEEQRVSAQWKAG